MDDTKLAVIAGTLAKQVERNRDLASVARREMHEHNGAGQVLTLLGKQMPSFAVEIERRIESDEDLGSEAARHVRTYVKNVIARFQVMCEQQAIHQRNQMLVCEGRVQAADQAIALMEKDIALERAIVARRQEIEQERASAEEPPVAEESAAEEKKSRRRKK
jgi:hypothetical protein